MGENGAQCNAGGDEEKEEDEEGHEREVGAVNVWLYQKKARAPRTVETNTRASTSTRRRIGGLRLGWSPDPVDNRLTAVAKTLQPFHLLTRRTSPIQSMPLLSFFPS